MLHLSNAPLNPKKTLMKYPPPPPIQCLARLAKRIMDTSAHAFSSYQKTGGNQPLNLHADL